MAMTKLPNHIAARVEELAKKRLSYGSTTAFRAGAIALWEILSEVSEDAENEYVKVIQEWLFHWMNQKQNSEADYKNYLRRAMGVDANMRHDLKNRLMKNLSPTLSRVKENKDES